MVWWNGTGNPVRTGLVVILLLINILPVYSQQNITQNRAVVGRDLQIVIPTEQPYSSDLRPVIEGIPEGVSITYGPVVRSYRKEWVTEGRREVLALAEIRVNLRASRPGIYTIDSIRLEREGSTKELEPFYFLAFQWDEINNNYPLTVQWKDPVLQIYQGQAVPLMLETFYTESILFAESISFSSPSGGVLEQISLPGEISSLALDEDHLLYRYPLESWIFTALNPGKITLRGGEVLINGLKRSIPALQLEVLALPEEVKQSSAVGRFQWRLESERSQVTLGESFELTLVIEGVGNLPSLRVPEPVAGESWEILSQREELDLNPHITQGYWGSKTIHYRLRSTKEGVQRIRVPGLTYWDSESESLKTLSPLSQNINVLLPEEEAEENPFPLLSASSLITNRDRFHILNGKIYLLLIPLFIAAFIVALIKRIKWGSVTVVLAILLISSSSAENQDLLNQFQQADLYAQEGEYQKALEIYHTNQEQIGFNSYYFYNKGVLHWKSGEKGLAEWSLRMALMGKPGNTLFMNALNSLDYDLALNDQYMGILNLKQNLYLSLFFLAAFLFFLSLGFHLYLNRTHTLLIICAALSVWLLAAGPVIYVIHEAKRDSAVVLQSDIPLKKIQGLYARDWITLSQGTSIEILSDHKEYFFIKTGFGLKGWVEKEDVIRLYYGGANG